MGNPSYVLLPYNFFTKNTSYIYLPCNWSLMFSHNHQNMYLWQDTAFPHSENTVMGNPSYMMLPPKFFTNITSNIYLPCNWSLMFSHNHQNMYLWQDTVFPHSENIKWWATPVTCCCLRTFPQKIHLIFICNVIGISRSVTNTRTCICDKILHFRTVKTHICWQPQSHTVVLQFLAKITINL
jgi:hypothetical protein